MVSAGPVHGATVSAYALNADGTTGDLLDSSTTDSEGNYDLDFIPPGGPISIVARGGTYEEEAGASSVSLGNAEIRTLLPSVEEGQEVGVTPVTEIATQSALAAALSNTSEDLAEIITAKNAMVSTAMGLTDITLPPSNPNRAGDLNNVEAGRYAVVLGAISQMAKDSSTGLTTISSLDLMQALAITFAYNGNFDATVGGTLDVPVPNSNGDTIKLSDAFNSSSFDLALNAARTAYISSEQGARLVRADNNNGVPFFTMPSFVTAPPPPATAPTLIYPPPPTELSSESPIVAGPLPPPPAELPPPELISPPPLIPGMILWEPAMFTATGTNHCFGPRYVGFSLKYQLWIGAELCNTTGTEYKLFLSPVKDGVYHEIADFAGHGQDHCELVNPAFTIPNEDDITSGGCTTCMVFGLFDVIGDPVFARANFGQPFVLAPSRDWADLTTLRYSCGVKIGP